MMREAFGVREACFRFAIKPVKLSDEPYVRRAVQVHQKVRCSPAAGHPQAIDRMRPGSPSMAAWCAVQNSENKLLQPKMPLVYSSLRLSRFFRASRECLFVLFIAKCRQSINWF